MKITKVILRADGDSQMGLGHLYRLIAVAEIIKERFEVIFITRENSSVSIIPNEFLINIIPGKVTIEDEVDWISHSFDSDEYLFIADGYQFDSIYQKRIKEVGYYLIYIDDLVKGHIYADVVVNHSPSVAEGDYQSEKYTQFALGTKYAMLRPPFIEKASQSRVIKSIDTCFVCFGGADTYNLTEKAVKALVKVEAIKKVNVVVGNAYLHKGIFEIKDENTEINVFQDIGEKQLCEIMNECNMAIVPSSTISYEVCSVKMPVLGGYYVANQKGIYRGLIQNAVIFDGGNFEDYTIVKFENKIKDLIKENNYSFYIENQSKLFDGKVKERFIELLDKLN